MRRANANFVNIHEMVVAAAYWNEKQCTISIERTQKPKNISMPFAAV